MSLNQEQLRLDAIIITDMLQSTLVLENLPKIVQ
jgi:hypothetical protein